MRTNKLGPLVRQCVALLACLLTSGVFAQPYIPAGNDVVLERLPAAPETRTLAPLRRAMQKNPQDLQSALQLARGYLEIGRKTSDPRFVSYAQSVLIPWMKQDTPPVPVLVLQATALQNMHRFSEAVALLDRALIVEPRNVQARLTKATLAQVQGKFEDARRSCTQLLRSADQSIALTCLLGVDSLTGKLRASYQTLERVALATGGSRSPEDAWMIGQIAEMALRLGDRSAAERNFKSALQVQPDDVYLQAAYADLLLLQQRNEEVIERLRNRSSHDVLLLRLAIAGRRTQVADARRWADTFDARRRATRAAENPHLREHARFLLEVLDKPIEALPLARKNWEMQREPADIQLYARAARAARSTADMRALEHWVRQTKYEDQALDALFAPSAHSFSARRRSTEVSQ